MKLPLLLLLIPGIVLLIQSAWTGAATVQDGLPALEFDKELGADAEREILANPTEYPILARESNADAYAYLDGIMKRLLDSGQVEHARDFDWTLHVIDKRDTINAFATPGGYIYVYTGLILYLDNEAELAGVLAHEIAHADRRHSTKQMARSTLARLLQRRRGNQATPVLKELLSLRHSRSHEAEADADAVRTVCGTHYHARSITGFFEKLSAEGGQRTPEFLSTHPNDENRVAAMTAEIAKNNCPGEVENASGHEAIKAVLPTTAPTDAAELVRGGRYCELFIVRRKGLGAEAEVWGTQGVSACPSDCNEAFDKQAIQSETGALRVVVNGPRIWLPNSPAPKPPETARRTFGTIEMGLVAVVKVERGEDNVRYKERTVPRATSVTFSRGEQVYELTSPQGAIYVMKSMSQTVDPSLTMTQLASLGARLKLPSGWTYQARVLEQDLTVAADRETVVLDDDLRNTYQRR